MARVVGRGILQGHSAARGWWAFSDLPSDDFTDALFDPDTGVSPLIRVRPFISKENNYKMDQYFLAKFPSIRRIDEFDYLRAVGNVSSSISYDTNKMNIGNCSFQLMDNDQRYVDNVLGSLLFQKYDEFARLFISNISGTFIIPNTITGDTSGANSIPAVIGSDFIDVALQSDTQFEVEEDIQQIGSGATATVDSIEIFPFRYHFKYCIIEIGFDVAGKKHDDNFWFPIFKGQITSKKEDERNRLVSFNLQDESKVIFDEELAPLRKASDVISYDSVTVDDRDVQMGLYYGKHSFLAKNAKNRNDQIMIPVIFNEEGTAKGVTKRLLMTPQATNILQIKDDILFLSNNSRDRIYFWMWDDVTPFPGLTEPQWAYLDLSQVRLQGNAVVPQTDGSYKIQMEAPFTINDALDFITADGAVIEASFNTYFDAPTGQDEIEAFNPLVKITADRIKDNMAVILFETLVHQVGIKQREFDIKFRSTVDDKTPLRSKVLNEQGSVSLIDGNITGESDQINFYSWNDAFYYMDSYELKTGVHIETSTRAIQLIDKMISFIRGAFFIGQGTQKDSISPLPQEDWTDLTALDDHNTRRVKLVINQARPVFDGIPELSEDKIRDVNISRSVADVINSCTVQNFDYNVLTSDFKSITSFESTSENSISVYGKKTLEIKSIPGKLAYIYDSNSYTQQLSSHFVLIFKDPPIKLTFNTNLIGMSYRDGLPEFDLKRLVYIKEELFTGLPGDVSTRGLFEIHERKFNTNTFAFSFVLFWAGYLLAPDGDIENKKWAFADNPDSFCDVGPDGFTYHAW